MERNPGQQVGGQAPQGEEKTPGKERKGGVGHSSGDRNEDKYANHTATGEQEPRGRAASGESYEDEADDALLRRPSKQASVKSYDGGNLGPSGEVIPGGDPSREPQAPGRETQ